MKNILTVVISVLFFGISVTAQTKSDLKRYFEGQYVRLKIDMPATKDGVNIYADRSQSLDFSEYAQRLKKHGVAIRRGEEIMITKIKVEGKHVEVQLGGGGYGTFGDETAGSTPVTGTPKSQRERSLEDELKRETDPERRRRLKEQIAELRRRRERENRRNEAIAAQADKIRRARVEYKALQGGSRFNVRYQMVDSGRLTPRELKEALKQYIDFPENDGPASQQLTESVPLMVVSGRVVRVGPSTTFIKAGLTKAEVIRLLGQPLAVSSREEEGASKTLYEFNRGGGRVLTAEFLDDVLVGSTITSHTQANVSDAGS